MFLQINEAPGYDVNASGVVRSYHRRGIGKIIGVTPRVLKQMFRRKTGYFYVHLRWNGKRKKVPIHVVVLSAFVGPRPPGLQGCHANGRSTDNALTNLRWDTPKANQLDSIRHGTKSRGERVATKLTAQKVRLIRRDVSRGESPTVLAMKFGVSYQHIYRVIRRQCWAHLVSEIP